jgi:hypothetical protein
MPPKKAARSEDKNSKDATKKRARNTKRKTVPPEKEKVASTLRHALLLAETNGILRPFLTGATRAFRNLAKRAAGNHDSPSARHLRLGRDVVTAHLVSLMEELDTQTKVEIIQDLAFDFYLKSSRDAETLAHAERLKIERNENAAFGILLMLRQTAWLYCKLVDEGHEMLANELPIYAFDLVRTLDRIAREQPHLVKDFAAQVVEWPVMAARHYPKKSDFKELADRIGLASQSPINPKERQTWKTTTLLNRYLLRMIVDEGWGEGRELTKKSVPYYLDKVLMPLFEKVAMEEGGWENYKEFADIARSAAKRGKSGVQKSEIRSRVKKALRALASDD